MNVLKRTWVPLVVAIAALLGGVGVEQLRGHFGSDSIFSATASSAEPLPSTHVKQVTYEVFGPAATTGSLSYLTMKAQPITAAFSGLPWTLTVSTTAPAVMANLVAQGNSDTIGCRIIVNGAIRDEQSSIGHHPQTSCLVKAA